MIAVDTLTRSITVSLGGAKATEDATWVATYLTPTGVHASAVGSTNGTVAITIVPAPSGVAGGVNQLLSFSLWNKDTAPIAITVTYVDTAGSNHVLQAISLATLESLIYEDKSGWSGLDSAGNTKVASGGSAVGASSQASSMAALNPASVSSQASLATVTNTNQSTSLATISSALSSYMLQISYTPTTWTPAVTSGGGTLPTFAVKDGTYTRIGRLVFFNAQLHNVTGGTAGAGANQLSISLPIATSASQLEVRIQVGTALNNADEMIIFATVPAGVGSTMLLWKQINGGADPELVALTNADFNHANIRELDVMCKILVA